MKYAVITFGCRVNQADSLGFEEELLARGAEPTGMDTADLVIVNTCSVTATADQGARQTIRRVARANPRARIVVTGCYATRAAEELRSLPNVERVVLNDDKHRLVPLMYNGQAQGLPLQVTARPSSHGQIAAEDCRGNPSGCPDVTIADRFGDGDGSCGASIEPGVAGRTAFTLRVQTGCSEPCSYCIIPSTRGAPRSVAIDDVVRDVNRIAAAGFKEIAMTGVHLGSYGRDLTPPRSLLDLLRALDRSVSASAERAPGRAGDMAQGSSRNSVAQGDGASCGPAILFRISSLEPMDCTREIVDLVARSAAFAPHFHLPLQHASDRMLAAMRRPYGISDYAALVNDVRTRVPSASIGSDIIVGFPGETDEDFDRLVEYLERSPLSHLHMFPYSDRPGTAASAMKNKVPGAVVRERGRHVREIGGRLTRRFRESQLGTMHRALTLDDGSVAVTGNYLKLAIRPRRTRNEWIQVKVTGTADALAGEVLDCQSARVASRADVS